MTKMKQQLKESVIQNTERDQQCGSLQDKRKQNQKLKQTYDGGRGIKGSIQRQEMKIDGAVEKERSEFKASDRVGWGAVLTHWRSDGG